MLVDDPRVSRTHLRVETAAGHWVGVDVSRNGVYLAGARQGSPVRSYQAGGPGVHTHRTDNRPHRGLQPAGQNVKHGARGFRSTEQTGTPENTQRETAQASAHRPRKFKVQTVFSVGDVINTG